MHNWPTVRMLLKISNSDVEMRRKLVNELQDFVKHFLPLSDKERIRTDKMVYYFLSTLDDVRTPEEEKVSLMVKKGG